MNKLSWLGIIRRNGLRWIWFILLVMAVKEPIWAAEIGHIIKSIAIKGNQKVDDYIIREAIKSKPAESHIPRRLSQDIKRIYQLGYFDDIRVNLQSSPQGAVLTYWLKERPTIELLTIKGNKDITTQEIEDAFAFRLHAVFDRYALWQGGRRVKQLYKDRGYHFALVEPWWSIMPGHQVDLRLAIREGKPVRVRKIHFIGNRSFKEKELKAVMNSKERGLLTALFSQDLYLEQKLKEDLKRLRNFYTDRGFFACQVGEPRMELDRERGEVSISIPIDEGDQFRVGDIILEGDELYSREELKRGLVTKGEALLSRNDLKTDAAYLVDLYTQKGYALCYVEPVVALDPERRLARVGFTIERGPQLHIGKVQVLGNSKIKEDVIHRELSFREGDLFDTRSLALTKKRLEKTGYFQGVEIEPLIQTSQKDTLELRVKVAEKSAPEMTLGGGYSTTSSFLTLAELEQINLFDSGLQLKLDGELAGKGSRFGLDLSHPHFLDRPLWTTLSFYNKQKKHPFFDTDRLGGKLSLQRNLFEYVRGELALKYEMVNIEEPEGERLWKLFEDERGGSIASIRTAFSRETLDKPNFPSRGSRSIFYLEMAPPLGDSSFLKSELDWERYMPLLHFGRLEKRDWVLKLHGNLGLGAALGRRGLPLSERFFLGGDSSLRGYGYEEIGPLNQAGKSLGGYFRTLLSAEVQFPLPFSFPFSDNIRGVSFLEMGDLFGKGEGAEMLNIFSYKKSTGLGLRIKTPFGPIRLDWAYKLDPGKSNRQGDLYKIHFGFGSNF